MNGQPLDDLGADGKSEGVQMTSTTGLDMVAAAKALRPQIIAAREEMDQHRRLPPSLVAAMDEAGLFRTYMPGSLGGPEADPVTAFHIVEELAKTDGSVGWCCFIAGSLSLFTGWLETPVARELFGTPPTLRGAGSFRPLGTARITDGGYIVTGQWDFASGCLHANWFALNCVVADENGPQVNAGGPLDGLPELRMMTVPVEDVRVIENWSVIGLHGTGSNDVAVADLFVPENRTFALVDQPFDSAPLCTFRSAMAVTFTPLAGHTLGLARGAMNAFQELAGTSATTMNTALLRDRPQVQEVVGRAEAIISGARAYVLDSASAMWEATQSGDERLGDKVLQTRLAVTHAVHESERAIDMLYHASGTNAIRSSNLLERYFRDVNAAMMHAGGLVANFEQGGRVAMGLPPGAPGW